MKMLTVVGARPQFIKAAAISRCIQQNYADKIQEVLVHTGQHYDENMSQVFFDELGIPSPAYHLNVAGGSHGSMTGKMLEAIELCLQKEKPDLLLVYGDTNSTLAGALAAVKLHIPIAHIEAGLRSFNPRMPEEINRILTDRISNLLFCPTDQAVKNLAAEGMTKGVHQVGDVMCDVALEQGEKAASQSQILAKLGLQPENFYLVTCHRAENTNDPKRLEPILQALASIAENAKVVFPIHPRTKAYIEQYGLGHYLQALCLTEPLPYLDMLVLERSAKAILTDSGGVQKEAFFYSVPCITLRDETEWVETVESGWNRIVGVDTKAILEAVSNATKGRESYFPYGRGQASRSIIEKILG